jgi:2-polyprenyl-3-methyl-5-hydroxy-6-metoxy-1,4-benzoquinol methylase
MPDLDKLNQSLDQMIQLMVNMKESLQDDPKPQAAQEKPKPQAQPPKKQRVKAQSKEDFASFEQLKKALESDQWPEAVNPNLICDPTSETDKNERGRGIIELMIEEELKGLKVLDFGCGEGHCAFLATEYGVEKAVGFDIQSQAAWSKFPTSENLTFTTNFQEVSENGPYDIILLFDVIDHVKGAEPAKVLAQAKDLLTDGGKIYMRCHPFLSRHATHLYHDLNKAYIHLVFTEEELKQIVPNARFVEDSIRVLYPLKTYGDFTRDAKLKSVNRRDVTEKVEPFFKIPKIAERIIQHSGMDQFPEFQMSLQFVDFVLKK